MYILILSALSQLDVSHRSILGICILSKPDQDLKMHFLFQFILPVNGPQVLEVILLGEYEDDGVVAIPTAGVHLNKVTGWRGLKIFC